MILHIINILTFIGVLFGMLYVLEYFSSLFAIVIPFVVIGFIYNIFFIWIVNKSKVGCRKMDFFSTWGAKRIRNNYSDYFEDKYIKSYKIISNISYLFPIIFLIIIITFLVIALQET